MNVARIDELTAQYETLLSEAVEANRQRTFYAHWPEIPSGKIYGETANADGENTFKARLNRDFEELKQDGEYVMLGEEESPYGFSLGIRYPVFHEETLVANAVKAGREWWGLTPQQRAAILIETLERSARSFFEITYATMHTTGQGFMMAFQASGPHSYDRALEAVAMGYSAQTFFATDVEWTKPMGKSAVVLKKKFRLVPKGIGLVVGCSTFPIWNSLPGIFASLVTGNPVIVKPHPRAVLPIAVVVADMQRVLEELGLDPHIVQLAADTLEQPLAAKLAGHPAVKVIDYTGGSAFGTYLEKLGAEQHKVVLTEKAGVNPAVLDSVANLDAVLDNLAFSVSLYSGQMCTAPQNIFINANGVQEGETRVPFEEVVRRFTEKIDAIAANEKIGPSTFGAIQNEQTLTRANEATHWNVQVVRQGQPIGQPGFENARTATPTVLQASAEQTNIYERECFGPVVFVVPVESFEHGVELAVHGVREHGALSVAVYTTDAAQQQYAEDHFLMAGAPVAFNFVGPIWVNQSATFSDFHGTGANPAGSASFADLSFVTSRFNIIGVRSIA